MSRRLEKAWEEFLNEHTVGGGGEYSVDWVGAAKSIGVRAGDYVEYGADDDGLMEAVRDAFYKADSGASRPLAMVTLRCQRCDRRIDAWRIRPGRWVMSEAEGWVLRDMRVTSEVWVKEVGDSIHALLRHFENRPISFDCACGRRGLQFSVQRLLKTLTDLLPTKPQFAGRDPDVVMVWPPATRRTTIRG